MKKLHLESTLSKVINLHHSGVAHDFNKGDLIPIDFWCLEVVDFIWLEEVLSWWLYIFVASSRLKRGFVVSEFFNDNFTLPWRSALVGPFFLGSGNALWDSNFFGNVKTHCDS